MVSFAKVASSLVVFNVLSVSVYMIFKKMITKNEPNGYETVISHVSTESTTEHQPSVWEVDHVDFDAADNGKKIIIAYTEPGFKLACLLDKKGQKKCSELAKKLGKQLQYVELLEGDLLLKSFCSSDLNTLPDHFEHMCSYHSVPPCSPLRVFDMNYVINGMVRELCTTMAVRTSDQGPLVYRTSACDTISGPAINSVVEDCKMNHPTIPGPQDKFWTKMKDAIMQCSLVEDDEKNG